MMEDLNKDAHVQGKRNGADTNVNIDPLGVVTMANLGACASNDCILLP